MRVAPSEARSSHGLAAGGGAAVEDAGGDAVGDQAGLADRSDERHLEVVEAG